MKKILAAFMIIGLVMAAAAQPALAAEEETGALVVKKLFRGIANAATGWMEIFKQTSLVWQEDGPGVGLSWGLAKGVGYAIARSVLGAYEIVTFPVPVPEGYRPIMQPEFVMSDLEQSSYKK
ncbi:MAG: exosortase system-associated protein, TIGR04073 family [Candidatus Omnitrophica bacterium]|nr:exosortase system-associated protein, TIGR04073 family [Candidatus Omnitrophota bacterium]